MGNGITGRKGWRRSEGVRLGRCVTGVEEAMSGESTNSTRPSRKLKEKIITTQSAHNYSTMIIITALQVRTLQSYFESTRIGSVTRNLMVQIYDFLKLIERGCYGICSNPKFGTGHNFQKIPLVFGPKIDF